MRLSVRIVALLVLAACGVETQRVPGTRTTIRERVPVRGLADSVAAPAPPDIALQMVADTAAVTPGAPPQPVPVATADTATAICPRALRDPATSGRFLMARSTVRMQVDSSTPDVVRWRHEGWADYVPVEPARVGLASGQRLRVDCATLTVAGIAPDSTP